MAYCDGSNRFCFEIAPGWIFTYATFGFGVKLVSHVADTLVGAKNVEASSAPAQSGKSNALVDVFQKNCNRIRNKTKSAGTESVVLKRK